MADFVKDAESAMGSGGSGGQGQEQGNQAGGGGGGMDNSVNQGMYDTCQLNSTQPSLLTFSLYITYTKGYLDVC